MAYPMPLQQYDEYKKEKLDFEYMKSMYPEMAKRLLPYVELECEHMEYTGSMIYDEYPDRLQIYRMCNRIYEEVKDMEQEEIDIEKEKWLKELIQIMLFHELYEKRYCQRRKHRKLYWE